MGMPACRISDTTAHGGIVTVGLPTVLIGFLPASRIGDLHTCPMVTGVVPHVGGPFILGSPTVLVGMMPQSRVTDQLTCVGPPDVALKGEPTVLVGMAGAGGMVSASSGLSVMAVPVPMASPPAVGGGSPSAAPELQQEGAAGGAPVTASLLQDGTMKIAAVHVAAAIPAALPPIALAQEGWPDLPPEVTCTFRTVQPANLQPGTRLYALADADATPDTLHFWTADAPSSGVGDSWNGATHVMVATVPQGAALKAWAGEGAVVGKLQVWMPRGSLPTSPMQRFRMEKAA